MRRWTTRVGLLIGLAIVIWVAGERIELWSGSMRPESAASNPRSQAQAALGEAEALESAFVKVAQQIGPSVVSISTEQIERVRHYFRGHPFFGDEPFDEFFRQFFGEIPEQEFKRFGLGSGVIIDPQGLILTNEHVVGDADKIMVTLSDGREFSGEVKGKDIRSDLAVIKIDAPGLPSAPLGDSEHLRIGQWAIAIGNPFGIMTPANPEPTLTVGVVSALHRRLPRTSRFDRDYSDLIQTDAAINPGNSGGPLVNLRGEIVGINVAILTSSRGYEGVGFAIPINKAKAILDALIEGRKVQYGWLGVQIQDITQDVAEFYGLSDREGVLVYQVLPGSPADQAGMKDGDIIKTFDGQPVKNSRELVDRVGKTKINRRAKVELLREGKRQALEVTVGERPAEGELAAAGEELWRGLSVAALSPQLAEQFGLDLGTVGVVIVQVEPKSPSDAAGLRAGDVINEINRMRVESVNDYRQAISRVQGNALVRTNRGYVVVKAGP